MLPGSLEAGRRIWLVPRSAKSDRIAVFLDILSTLLTSPGCGLCASSRVKPWQCLASICCAISD